jgi:plastocyanin
MSLRRPFLFSLLVIGIVAPTALPAADDPSAEQSVVVPIDTDGVQRLTMVLDSYSYSPSHVIVQSGRPVELLLKSVTTITPHNFILKDEASGLSLDRDVGAGKNAVLRFTPTEKGIFPFFCDKKLLFFASHREKGMEGKLEVR